MVRGKYVGTKRGNDVQRKGEKIPNDAANER